MSSMDDFTLVSAPTTSSSIFGDYQENASGTRKVSELQLAISLRKAHPDLNLTVAGAGINLLGFARAGHARALLDTRDDGYFFIRNYAPPNRRLNGDQGGLVDQIRFAKYYYNHRGNDFIVYLADSYKEGGFGNPVFSYILHKPDAGETVRTKSAATDSLILATGKWGDELHDEIWVFDQGYWQKNTELYKSVQKASWDDVILDPDMKKGVVDDIEGFFDERDSYKRYAIPWKRGIIFYGPPGNGKTISVKALMKSLSDHTPSIPSLYVKSLVSFAGPEYAIRQIFERARQTAPCLLIFEDLDSLVTDQVRSYFLNEVDGLESNDGILMVGSTNHLERLDPGIVKRPSRFDRKYLFPLPVRAERIQYCEYWRAKLSSNKEIDFPKNLSPAIADITDKFSFAYMKEAFLATLLKLKVGSSRDGAWFYGGSDNDDLNDLPLWREMKKQVKILREEMDAEALTGAQTQVAELKV